MMDDKLTKIELEALPKWFRAIVEDTKWEGELWGWSILVSTRHFIDWAKLLAKRTLILRADLEAISEIKEDDYAHYAWPWLEELAEQNREALEE